MDYSQFDDATLLALMAADQPEALGELYARYQRLVYSLALAIVTEPATADEITLEVFTRLWLRAAGYRHEKAKVTTWMTVITRHLAIDALRRRKARPEVRSADWSELAVSGDLRQTEERVELALQRQRVRAALAQLPPEQRQALALAYFQGLTHPQIAAALQQPLGTVKTRIRLALHKLRQALRAEQSLDDQSSGAADAYHSDTTPEDK